MEYTGTRDVPLADLTRFPGNARRGDQEAIRASLRATGQYRSLVVRRQDDGALVILAGNNTADALEAEGHTTARCEVITCTGAEATRINVADNKLGALGADDPHALLALLEGLDEDLEGTGYDLDELDDLRAQLDAVPTLPPGPTGAREALTDEERAEREGRAEAYEPRVTGGTAEVILVVTVEQRDEITDLLRRIRDRDGDEPAGRIVLAALRRHAPHDGGDSEDADADADEVGE